MSPRVLSREIIAGLVTSLALIPEVLAFSIMAGVDPTVGLFTSVVMAVTSAIVGGRPAMITAAAGAVALVTAPLIRAHGVTYLVAAVLLGGLLQILISLTPLPERVEQIPRPVMSGFLNSLAILMFLAQLPELMNAPWAVYPLFVLGLAVVFLLPRATTAVPSPFAAIVVVTAVAALAGWRVPSVGDKGELPTSLPQFVWPSVPLTGETLGIVAPYAVAIALVGLLESLMTARMVDSITGTESGKRREARGQGLSNIAAAFVGGMGGCAMIGQTMINVKAQGARTRLSTAAAGLWLLLFCVALSPLVARIPMAVLVAIMVYVSATTFDVASIRPSVVLRRPRWELVVMAVTVACVVPTHNLAIGVAAGILAAWVLGRLRERGGKPGRAAR